MKGVFNRSQDLCWTGHKTKPKHSKNERKQKKMFSSKRTIATACALFLATPTASLRPSMHAAKNIMQRTPEWTIHQNMQSTRNLMAKAFSSGEPVVDWLVRDIDIPQDDLQKRLDTYKFLVSFPIKDALSQGSLVLGKGSEQVMECGVLFREYDPETDGKKGIKKELKSAFHSLSTYFGMGKARKVGPFKGFLSKQTQAFFNKGSFFDGVSSSFHSKYGPSAPHWYITFVGVDPDRQGKGHGKQLMGQLGALADEVGMDVYLECAGARNKGFYEKMGFQQVGLGYLDDGTSGEKQEICLMIRPKASNLVRN
jgi:ribosomal protein S18 acetylase RimI-like enzyme